MTPEERPLRILSCCHTWQGSTDYGFVRAFRRAGHSVVNLSEAEFFPGGWRNPVLRLARRAALPLLLRDYQQAFVDAARAAPIDLFFVFKGTFITPQTVEAVRRLGAVAINVYPDVSFTVHGPLIPKALPAYDWVFTTKSFGVTRASFLPHGFDPETHSPVALDDIEMRTYGCDAAFIGTWSPKKEEVLRRVKQRLPGLTLKIWGHGWGGSSLDEAIHTRSVLGREYAKAIAGAKINLAMLSNARGEASSGDLTTTRSFEIPATGGFMLHERTSEAQAYFEEGRDCAMFGDTDELVDKIAFYLDHPQERLALARAGHVRCLADGHSVDERAKVVLAKVREIAGARSGRVSVPA